MLDWLGRESIAENTLALRDVFHLLLILVFVAVILWVESCVIV